MALWAKIFISTLLLIIAQKLISSKLRTRRYKQESFRRGCLPAPTLASNNLLGTSRLKESIKATKEDRGPQYVISAMNEVGLNIHTVRVPILDYELLVTRDPENVRAILSAQVSDYDISETRANAFMPLLGEGIFTSRGTKWKHSRSLIRPQFSHEQVSNLAMIDRHAQILLNVLKTDEGGWTQEMDIQPFFFHFTLDTATEFLYGQSVHSQTATAFPKNTVSAIDGAAFSENLDAAKYLVDKRGALGKFYWLMPLKKMKHHCAEVHKVVDHLIHLRLHSPKSDFSMEEKGGKKFVLLDELAKETSDLQELRNETLHTLMAGRDPTGCLLAWTFYFLSRHPYIYQRLRTTIITEFGKSIKSTDIDSNNLRKCEYLQWVMNETLRMVSVIPMNERIALCDTTLPRGGGPDGSSPIFVRKGIQILIPFYAILHRPDIWGEDVEAFRPDRWDGRRVGWEWTPFGGGPRKCLGQQFAMTESAYLIVRILQKFDSCENMEGLGDIKLHTAIENRSGTGVRVRFRKAVSD